MLQSRPSLAMPQLAEYVDAQKCSSAVTMKYKHLRHSIQSAYMIGNLRTIMFIDNLFAAGDTTLLL